MTCIIGLEQDGKVYVGADSLVGNGGWARKELVPNPKIFQKHEIIIAGTGDLRAMQIVKYLINIDHPKKFDEEYVIKNISEIIRLKFKDIGYSEIKDNCEKSFTYLLVAYKDKMFKINGQYAVSRRKDGLICLGAGEDFAFGAMKAFENLEPENRIRKSLEIASYYSGAVMEPFTVLKTK